MNRRTSVLLIFCLILFLSVTICHEAFHQDADDCFICSWIASVRDLLGALLLLCAVLTARLIGLRRSGAAAHNRRFPALHPSPVRLRVKLTD